MERVFAVCRNSLAGALVCAFFACAFSLVGGLSGSLNGVVRDASGAVIDGARVRATSMDRSFLREITTSRTGEFRIAPLEPGSYVVTVQAEGFRVAVLEHTIVQLDQQTSLAIEMEVGSLTETVEISAEAPLLDSGAATRKVTIPRELLAGIPLNGRQFLDLALLAPGAIPAPAGTQGGGFSAAGMRSQSNIYMLDGVSNMDTQTNQPLNLFRMTDAVREFSVHTSVAAPELGRGSGAQINVVTRAGTDEFHGSLFEYFRNTVLNASDFFTNRVAGVKNPLNRNQFGATFGGAAIPGRTYFFGSWEAFRQSAPTVSSTLTPTVAQRATVTDPIARRLLEFFPLPNAGRDQLYVSNVSNFDTDNTALARVDHQVSVSDRIAARWTQFWGYGETPGATSLSGGNQGRSSQVSAMLSERHVFSSGGLNELRLGYSRYAVARDPQDLGFDAGSIITGLDGDALPGVPRNAGLPTIAIGGGFATLGAGPNFPQSRAANTFEVFDNVSQPAPFGWSRHSWTWGVHIRREDAVRTLGRASRGSLNFANFADFARGMINSATFRTGSTYSTWQRYPIALYWQDQFRPTPRVSLTFGLRYEAPGAVTELRNRATNYVPGIGPVIAGAGQVLDIDPLRTGYAALILRTSGESLPASGMHADRNNFAPALGLAWSPGAGDRTVIRAGARISYDDPFNIIPMSMALAPPHTLQTTQTANVTQPGRFGWNVAFDQEVPLVSNYGRQGPGTPTVGILALQGVDINLRTAYAAIYHAGLQHRVGSTVIEVDYQGSLGRKLGMYVDVNQPNVIVRDPARRGPVAPNEQVFVDPRFGQIQLAKSIGTSSYNGLVAAVRTHKRDGSVMHAWYAFGKSLDSNSSYFGSGNQPGEPGAPIDNRNLALERGPSAFDVRHRFVAAWVLPVHRPKFTSSVLNAVARNWQASLVAAVQSGSPFTVVHGGPDTSGFNQATQGNSPNAQNRPNLLGSGPVQQDNRNPDAAFDKTRFGPAMPGSPGTSGRNTLYGPGLQNFNLAIGRIARVGGDRGRLEFRAEFFNVLNRTNFANPVSDLNNANFGQITQTQGSTASNSTTGGATGGPRVVQLVLRFAF